MSSHTQPIFLQDTPSRAQLLRAVAANHRQFIAAGARAHGGALQREHGVTWAYSPASTGKAEILFPRWSRERASEQLDALLEQCRSRRPLSSICCWSLLPARPVDLGVRLAARGFEWGWQPHWMGLDLSQLRADHPRPPGLRIEGAEEQPIGEADELPFYDRDGTAVERLAREQPRRYWHFAAWMDGRVVGHSVLYLTTGRLGVAGIYSCGVIPSARGQGIGKAVIQAACEQARSLGCRYALLNATGMGEPVYRKLGFESLGLGQMWWMHRAAMEAPPPGPHAIAVAEAVGRGDREALDRWAGRATLAGTSSLTRPAGVRDGRRECGAGWW